MRDFKMNELYMNFKMNGLYILEGKHGKYYYPCGLSFIDKLWWRFMPGVIINVKWPRGKIVAGPGPTDPLWRDWGGAAYITFDSADPNDHYRPWLEKYVGKQGWDWDWGMANNDVAENRLTIKIRRKYAKYATIAAMHWS